MKATIPQLAPVEEVRRRLIESGGRRAEAEEQARQNSARSLKTRLLLSHQQGSNGRHAGPPLRLLSGCLRAAQGKKTHWEGRGVRADRENLPGNRRTGAADRAGEGAQTRGAGPGEGRGAQDRRAQTGRHQNTQSHSAPGGRQTAGLTQSRKKTTGSETSRARRTTASEGLCTKSGCRSTPTTCSSTTTASTSSTTTDAPSPPSCAARGSAPSRPAAPRGRSSPSAGPPVALFSATPPARWRD